MITILSRLRELKPIDTTQGQSMTNQLDRLVKLSELCTILGESRSTIMRNVERGVLPQPIKSGSAPNAPCRWWISDVKKALGAEERHL